VPELRPGDDFRNQFLPEFTEVTLDQCLLGASTYMLDFKIIFHIIFA
jgi:hypothetical protein